jgi:pimeloyl-ACP methyl ester carboxylesterase
MDILLIPGLWLRASAWDDVVPAIEARGHRAVPIALPGQGDGATDVELEDQVRAVVDAIDAADGPPLVVGHSAASTLAWIAADRRPDRVAGAVFIGGFPNADGSSYADFFPIVDGGMPFPGWEPFEGPDSADIGSAQREAFSAAAVPVPEGVARGVVRLTDDRRADVPTVAVCPEYSPEDVRGWIADGDVPEPPHAETMALVDIDSGHWPMLTRPEVLGGLLADEADRLAGARRS